MTSNRSCAHCGKRITPAPGAGRPAKFCSPACRGVAWRAANQPPPAPPRPRRRGKCGVCGVDIDVQRKYCSRQCTAISQRRTTPRVRWTKSLSGDTREQQLAHARERRKWEPTVAAGRAYCQQGIPGNGSSGTCLEPTRWIRPGTRWALGHRDDRTGWIGPTHYRCNHADAARRGGLARKAIYGPYRGDGQTMHQSAPPKPSLPVQDCAVCRLPFQPKTSRSATCSPQCAHRRSMLQAKEWRARNPERNKEHKARYRAAHRQEHIEYMRNRRRVSL